MKNREPTILRTHLITAVPAILSARAVNTLCTPRHAALALVLRKASRRLFGAIASWFDDRRQARRLRADLQALHALDEFTLHDLGLHRSEITSLLSNGQRGERRHHVLDRADPNPSLAAALVVRPTLQGGSD